MSEHIEQVSLIEWFDIQYPKIKGKLFAVPNGARVTIGQAVKLKRSGLRKGCPDLWLPIKLKSYSGLVIELKDLKGTVSPEQKDWLSFLSSQGFMTFVCFGFEDARKVITDYLS